MINTEINLTSALQQHATTLLTGLVDAVQLPGVPWSEPEPDKKWARLTVLRGDTFAAGAGIDAQSTYVGSFQISLFFPQGKGAGEILAAAQTIRDGFKRGTALTKAETSLRVREASVGSLVDEPKFIHLPILVRWIAYQQDND